MCPGSLREEAKYPSDGRSGPAAIDGTHTHTLVEKCVKGGLVDPLGMVGIKLIDPDGGFVVDRSRAERAKVMIDYVRERVGLLLGAATVLSETRVDPEWLVSRKDMHGTVDCMIKGTRTLEIIDYKDGMGLVSAENNPQLEQYAIGALADLRLGTNVPEQYPWETVTMTIVQPKLALKGMSPISSWTVPVKYLLDRVRVLTAEGRATDDPIAPLVPGESHCKYCAAKGCAARAQAGMKEAGIMFPMVTEQLDVVQQSAEKDPAQMSNDQIRQLLEAAPILRQVLEAAEAEALRRQQAGIVMPGLKLVYGRGANVWAYSEDEMADKLVKMGIPKGTVYETKLITPVKAKKATWTKRDGTQMQLSEKQLKRLEQEYISKVAGKLTVVAEADPRPAVIPNAAPLFSPVDAPAVTQLPTENVEKSQEVLALPAWLL